MTPQVVTFVAVCAMLTAPVMVVAALAGRRPWAFSAWIASAVVAGFLIGGLVGWSARPSAWQMPFWQTVDASMNAAKYGHPVESQAERVLLYFVYAAVLGAIGAAVMAVTGARLRIRCRHPGLVV